MGGKRLRRKPIRFLRREKRRVRPDGRQSGFLNRTGQGYRASEKATVIGACAPSNSYDEPRTAISLQWVMSWWIGGAQRVGSGPNSFDCLPACGQTQRQWI